MKTYKYKLRNIGKYGLLIAACMFAFSSCKKYLDAKPQTSLVTINSVQDLQLLLNNTGVMVENEPEIGQASGDDYFISYANWERRSNSDQGMYDWAQTPIWDNWTFAYTPVYYANLVLDNLSRIQGNSPSNIVNDLKGQALFYRGFSFYELAQSYSPPLTAANQNTQFGIALRLTSNVSAPSIRSTIRQTYDQIISDLNNAAALLPTTSNYPTTPTKAAAYGALARTYLTIGDYASAENAAKLCLAINDALIDYNSLTPKTLVSPFGTFNKEVIFHSQIGITAILASRFGCRVDSILQRSYNSNDLRNSLFFVKQSDGYYSFIGDYAGSNYPVFCGLATDEMYLIKAECEARRGDVTDAMADLNHLLITRWKTGTFVAFTAANQSDALNVILTERRKELLFRSIRWTDLRRLNQDPNYAVTLTRNLNGTIYTLPPNSPKYAYPIPPNVIALTGMQQNPQ